MDGKKRIIEAGKPLVVGSLGSAAALAECKREQWEKCDVVELRLDIFHAENVSWWSKEMPWHGWEVPILYTARIPAEGGRCELDMATVESMAELASYGSIWDMELMTWMNDDDRRDAITASWDDDAVTLVMSWHNFEKTPELDALRRLRDMAHAQGADVFKVATFLQSRADMDILLALQEESGDFPVATMGMGPLAAESRVRCALAGSVLNYGYLGDSPTAPGQWEAGRLRDAIRAKQIPQSEG